MTFSFHPEAEAEFYEAINYYEKCEEGLGEDFSIEVFLAVQHIVNYPSAWPVLEDDLRRCFVNRFPYGIVYSNEGDEVFILALMHLHRNPDYWRHRR